MGEPILIEFRSRLRVVRGELVSGAERGSAVHAGAFLRERRIVLDRSVLRNARERDRILAHELFHFVWWKCGQAKRIAYEAQIGSEFMRGVPGEMGWSAERRKQRLRAADLLQRKRCWREYLCESFCDTAAAYALGIAAHPEITLSVRARRSRMMWMKENLDLEQLRI